MSKSLTYLCLSNLFFDGNKQKFCMTTLFERRGSARQTNAFGYCKSITHSDPVLGDGLFVRCKTVLHRFHNPVSNIMFI